MAKLVDLILALAVATALTVAPLSAQTPAPGTLNLRNADISALIDLVAQLTGRNFIVDPRVSGTVTVVAPTAVTQEEIYEIFLNVLEINRFAVVEGAGADRIVPLQIARELPPPAEAGRAGGFETRAIRVEHIDLGEAVELIRPLLPAEASVSTQPSGRLLIISDRAANIERIERLLRRVDQPGEPRTPVPIETIPLRNARVGDVVEAVRALELTAPDASVTADVRANALVVRGDDTFREQVRALTAELDRPRQSLDAQVVQLRFADADELEDIVSRLFAGADAGGGSGTPATGGQGEGRVSVVADPRTNALLITAPPDLLPSIVRAIRQLDVRPRQVLIEGVIFEMAAGRFADLGVQFGALISNVLVGGVQFASPGRQPLGSIVTSLLAGQAPDVGSGVSIGAGYLGGDSGAVAFLSALARDSSTNILSTPTLVSLDNQEAEIVVAQNVPFVTGSFSNTGGGTTPLNPFQTIQREDVGLKLKVTPQISGDGAVRLNIEQEVSNLTTQASAAGGEITSRRAINTNVIVGDGRLILLGGLLEDSTSGEVQKVPGLGDVPVLGYLFRTKSADTSKRVLLVLLRPQIIRTSEEADAVTAARYNDARAQSTDLADRIDPNWPRVEPSDLPPLDASLGAPFTPTSRAARAAFPPLPSRLEFR
jgi:general secretion pathway protein D